MLDVGDHDVSRFDHEFVSVIDGKSQRDIFNPIGEDIMIGQGLSFSDGGSNSREIMRSLPQE